MWKKDIDVVKWLYEEFHFQGPLLDAGGLEQQCIADYDVSVKKAHRMSMQLEGQARNIVVPQVNQTDRYVNIIRPWSFIDPYYRIFNPEFGDSGIEDLPKLYSEAFRVLSQIFHRDEKISIDCLHYAARA